MSGNLNSSLKNVKISFKCEGISILWLKLLFLLRPLVLPAPQCLVSISSAQVQVDTFMSPSTSAGPRLPQSSSLLVTDPSVSAGLSVAPVSVSEDQDRRNMNRLTWRLRQLCQRCIRKGLCGPDGDTRRIETCSERLWYWILLPDSWVTFRLSGGGRGRDGFRRAVRLAALRRSSRWVKELMLHSAFSAEQGDRSRAAWPSSRSPVATGKLPGGAVGALWASRSCELWQLAKCRLGGSFICIASTVANPAGKFKGKGWASVESSVACSHRYFSVFLLTSEEALFINICSMTGPRPMLMPGIPMRLVLAHRQLGSSLLFLLLLPFFLAPLGRIYNFTFPFSGFKVSYKSQTRLKAPRSCSTGSPAVLRGDQIRTQPNEQTCFISAVMHLLPAPPEWTPSSASYSHPPTPPLKFTGFQILQCRSALFHSSEPRGRRSHEPLVSRAEWPTAENDGLEMTGSASVVHPSLAGVSRWACSACSITPAEPDEPSAWRDSLFPFFLFMLCEI